MTDRFEGWASGIDAPAANGFAITKSDSVGFATASRAIYVGGTGDVTAVLVSGDVITLVAVPGGAILPIRANRVNATGTSASNLVGLY